VSSPQSASSPPTLDSPNGSAAVLRSAPPPNTAVGEDAAAVGAAVLDERRRRVAHIDSAPKTEAEAVVLINNASKTFGEVEALGSLSLSVGQGRITVLLGPNGAGKTTAIRMITGALTPDDGEVLVYGYDPGGDDGEEVRRSCGVVSAKPSLYDRLSGSDNLQYAAELYGLGRGAKTERRILEAADQFGIAGDLDQRVGGYSTGMKTRLALARAVLHQPTLMLLDEPTSGLDPESAVAVLAMVRDMTADGKTVLMCTHLLLEAERLADQIVVMDNGNDLLAGHPDSLAERFWPRARVEITSSNGAALDGLRNQAGVIDYQRHDLTAVIQLDSQDRVTTLVTELVRVGADVRSVVPYRPSLEDLYFAIRRQYGLVGDGWGAEDNSWRRRGSQPPRSLPDPAERADATTSGGTK